VQLGVIGGAARCRAGVATIDNSATPRASARSQGGVMSDLTERIQLSREHRDLILEYAQRTGDGDPDMMW
jgi:hypothetical protein